MAPFLIMGPFPGDMFLLFNQIFKAVSTETCTNILFTEETSFVGEKSHLEERCLLFVKKKSGPKSSVSEARVQVLFLNKLVSFCLTSRHYTCHLDQAGILQKSM